MTITDIIPSGDETSVNIGTMDGQTADTIIYKSGLTVSGDIVSSTTTKIEYTEEDGKITISKIDVPNGGKAEIPAKINGMDVVEVAEDYRGNVDTTKHTTHTYGADDKCTICGDVKQNTGNDDSISLEKDGNTLTISGTGAVNDLSDLDGKESITDVVIDSGVTSVGENAFDGFTSLDTVYYPQGTAVGNNAFPTSPTQVEYSVNVNGTVTIENISGVVGGEKVDIPNKIGGKDVAGVAELVQHIVSAEGHTHTGGTATCSAQAVCSICATVYGDLAPNYHTYVNGVCTGCGTADPNAGGGSQGTTPTNPSAPTAPTVPSTPVVTPTVTETTSKEEEIIYGDDPYSEDISAGAGINENDEADNNVHHILIVIFATIAGISIIAAKKRFCNKKTK